MMRCDAFLADQIDFTNKRIWNQYHGAVKLKVGVMATVYQGTTIKIRCPVQGWEIDLLLSDIMILSVSGTSIMDRNNTRPGSDTKMALPQATITSPGPVNWGVVYLTGTSLVALGP